MIIRKFFFNPYCPNIHDFKLLRIKQLTSEDVESPPFVSPETKINAKFRIYSPNYDSSRTVSSWPEIDWKTKQNKC